MDYDRNEAITSFPVTARVSPSCAISAEDLQFITYSGAQLDARSLITVTCTEFDTVECRAEPGHLSWRNGDHAQNDRYQKKRLPGVRPVQGFRAHSELG